MSDQNVTLSKEESDTPNTDMYVTTRVDAMGESHHVVDADFAREQERTIAVLLAALRPFTRPEVFNQCDQIRDLITQISGNPVNGADAWRWWLGRHFNISMFKDAAVAVQRATQS